MLRYTVQKPINMTHVERIKEQVSASRDLYYRLVLLVGPHRSGKTTTLRTLSREAGWPVLNVSLALSESLLALSAAQRALKAADTFDDIVRKCEADPVLLDDVEVLFEPSLKLEPLRVLQSVARHRSVVAAWPGNYENDILTHATQDHPEYRSYTAPDALIVVAPGAGVDMTSSAQQGQRA